MIEKLGLQLYSVRTRMTDEKSTRETLGKLLELGYSEGQTADEKDYPGFARICREVGFGVCGTHGSFDDFIADPDRAMEIHDMLGTKFIGVGGMGAKYRESLSALEEFIGLANEFAAKIHKYGFRFTYHHHSVEFGKLEGKRMMDVLVDGLDPVTTSFTLDTYWIQHGGGNILEWMQKLDGRIDILHLKDMGIHELDKPFITEIGQGNINFDPIIELAGKIGVKHYVVEQDYCPGDPLESMRISSDYIHAKYMK